MGSLSCLSRCLSWKRIMAVFFLPLALSGLIPHIQYGEYMLSKTGRPQSRYNWSHLTPLKLKNRSVGLGIANTGGKAAHFTLEGHKFLIFGGSIHYFRVPREYWRDRLLKLKACGFNTLTTYIPWNLHEPERGKFDFSGNLDLEAFVLMAAEIGLWVILRPGPYICSEIDLGGLPSWLLQNPNLQLRTTNKDYVRAVDTYFNHLIPRIVPLQYHQGGPVIAVQVENEYGSFNKDKNYMAYLKEALLERGIVELLLTSDSEDKVVNGSIQGELAAVNLRFLRKNSFLQLHQLQSNKPILIMEYWIGWFDRWGYRHSHTHVKAKPLPSSPHLTPKTVYPAVRPSLYLPLWDALQYLDEAVKSVIPINMENLPINNGSGQSFGFILYETSICSGGILYAEAHDVAQVFVNNIIIGFLSDKVQKMRIPQFKGCQLLRILVENQGRISYSWRIQEEKKGLVGSVSINGISLKNFTIYPLEMKKSFFERLRFATWKPVPESYLGPAFYKGILKAGSSPVDTFLSLPGWNCGFVFVNGHNLGRYWKIGPQESLYLPGVWLHPEDNEIILFEKIRRGLSIRSRGKPKLKLF
ncbi:beta-galactosidase-1-like protein 3 isoform X3 [Dipodomys merriami]|uniref:beta-galactosidase-1-like protein 3 isoform X3 n=1 Tax=Dipodomys merriami TaxID=94247 RepID=UPI0038560633